MAMSTNTASARCERAFQRWTIMLLAALAWSLAAPEFAIATPLSNENRQQQAFAALPELDSRFQEALDAYLRQQIKAVSNKPSNQKLLFLALLDFIQGADKPLDKLVAIRLNMVRVLENLQHPRIFELLDFLYLKNDTAAIKRISDAIKQTGSPSFRATNYFLLAKYYNSRGNWKGVKAALANLDVNELSLADQHYYYLLMGFALQQLKEHRQGYLYYRKIPAESPYYAHAKLNEGTAYLRQGWWTEAQIEIKHALASTQSSSDQNFKDRLYTVLGYLQLHYEFYRDARESLRNVSINGQYTNKALMGLGLSAAYQKDYDGAINAFKILSEKTSHDLNVDEVKLLLPKAYEEIADFGMATSAYQNAIAYYNSRLLKIEKILSDLDKTPKSALGDALRELDFSELEIYGKPHYIPMYFYDNYQLIVAMQTKPLDADTIKTVDQLQSRYQTQLKMMVRDNIKLRKAIINSYLSQAKFGMANLYDNE